MAGEITDIGGSIPQAVAAGGGLVPDLSARIEQLMSTAMAQRGENQRAQLNSNTQLQAAGFQPNAATGQMEKPTPQDAMGKFNDILNQMGQDEDLVMKGPDWTLTRKGKKEFTDADLLKIAGSAAAADAKAGNLPDGMNVGALQAQYFANYKKMLIDVKKGPAAAGQSSDATSRARSIALSNIPVDNRGPAAGGMPPAAGNIGNPNIVNIPNAQSPFTTSGVQAAPATTPIPTAPVATSPSGPVHVIAKGMYGGRQVVKMSDGSIWDVHTKTRVK